MPGQEAVVERVEHGQHHVLEARKVTRRPARVGAHDLGRIRELVAVDARRQKAVRIAVDRGQRGRPCVQEDDREVGIARVLRDLPAQRQLIGTRDVDVHLREILVVAAADHGGQWARRGAQLGAPVRGQRVPAAEPGLGVGRHLRAHAFEVGLGVQEAGVDEGSRQRRRHRGLGGGWGNDCRIDLRRGSVLGCSACCAKSTNAEAATTSATGCSAQGRKTYRTQAEGAAGQRRSAVLGVKGMHECAVIVRICYSNMHASHSQAVLAWNGKADRTHRAAVRVVPDDVSCHLSPLMDPEMSVLHPLRRCVPELP